MVCFILQFSHSKLIHPQGCIESSFIPSSFCGVFDGEALPDLLFSHSCTDEHLSCCSFFRDKWCSRRHPYTGLLCSVEMCTGALDSIGASLPGLKRMLSWHSQALLGQFPGELDHSLLFSWDLNFKMANTHQGHFVKLVEEFTGPGNNI